MLCFFKNFHLYTYNTYNFRNLFIIAIRYPKNKHFTHQHYFGEQKSLIQKCIWSARIKRIHCVQMNDLRCWLEFKFKIIRVNSVNCQGDLYRKDSYKVTISLIESIYFALAKTLVRNMHSCGYLFSFLTFSSCLLIPFLKLLMTRKM